MSRIRQNFHEECEALINKQINMELYASYVYLSMVIISICKYHVFQIFIICFIIKNLATYFSQSYYFARDDVALHGYAKYFKKNSDEERDHAQKFMDYQVNVCNIFDRAHSSRHYFFSLFPSKFKGATALLLTQDLILSYFLLFINYIHNHFEYTSIE